MNTKNIISKGVSLLAIASLTLVAPFSASALETNPSLSNACGLDVALVLDHSTSLSAQDLQDEKDAAKAFVSAFLPGTPTLIGVVSFGTSASLLQDLTSNTTDINNAIDSITLSGSTNWADALTTATGILEGGSDRDDSQNPDLIVLFSDGEPNTGGSIEDAADAAKTSTSSMPIRILGVGIGSGISTSSFATITNGGSTVFSPPSAVGPNTDVVLSDFANLANDLAGLAAALCDEVGDDNPTKIKVTNNNGADVVNEVFVKSSTGGNDANGGDAGSAGNGGSVNNSEDGNTGGNGGSAGNGGNGGAIFTGTADAVSAITNLVNYNVTRVSGCDCGADLIKVRNNNGASVGNGVGVFAKTGYNDADGGNTGEGGAGNGGSVNNSDDDNTGGKGGNSGNGGTGGWIDTGSAFSVSSILNSINENLVRIN